MKTIKLQGIGTVNAKQAGELKVGDKTVWNFGAIEVVCGILKETRKTVTLQIRSQSSALHERRLNKTRLVGISSL